MNSVVLEEIQAPVLDRLAVLQWVRVSLAVAVIALPVLAGSSGVAWSVPLAYLLVVGVAELARRRIPTLAPPLLSALVLVDGAFLAAVVLLTADHASPLLFLVFLEVVAVTLLASPRTGIKVAVWCALLLFLGRTAATVGVLNLAVTGSDRTTVVTAAAFLLFAVGAAVFQSVNERTLRHTGVELAALVDLGAALERARRPVDVVAVLVAHLRERLGFARVLVVVRAEEDWIVGGDARHPGRCPGGLGGVGTTVLTDASPRLVRVLDAGLLSDQLPDARNVVVAPLTGDDQPLGVVVAEWGRESQARVPALTVASLVQSVAHAALTLRNARLLDEVERLATRDELTGLANRRLFEEALTLEVGRHRRTGAPLSLIALDIDHFKAINDAHGHPAGDAVLCAVGASLQASTKAFDVPARYGGDEFLVLLPGCAKRDVPGVAERLRRAGHEAVPGIVVTISAGAATLPDDVADSAALITAADAALYAAKRAGRDRVGVAHRI